MPHRRDRPVVGGDLRAAATRRARGRRWRRSTSTWSPRRRAGPAADAAVRPHDAEPRLHPGLPAGRARERRPVHPRRALDGARVRAMLGDGDRATELFAMLNPINHARTPDGGRALPRRAVRRGRRRLFAAAAHRPRRLDVVHGLGRLDVSRRHRSDSRPHAAQRRRCTSTRASRGLAGLRGGDQATAAPSIGSSSRTRPA